MASPRVGDFYIQRSNQDFWLRELVDGVPAWVRKGNIRDEGSSGIIGIQPVIAVGFTMGVQVDRWRFLESLADDYGLTMDAAVDLVREIGATSHALGFDMAADVLIGNFLSVPTDMGLEMLAILLDRTTDLTVSMAHGFSQSTTLTRTTFLSQSHAMGFSQASALSVIEPIPTTAHQLGFQQSSSITHIAALGKFLAVSTSTTPFLEIYNSSLSKITLPSGAGQFPSAAVTWVAFSPSGRYLAFCTAAKLFLYDMSTTIPTNVGTVASPPSWTGLNCIAWKPDSTQIVVTDSGVSPFCWVYDIATFTSQTAPAPGTGAICVDWSPDGSRIGIGRSASVWFKEYDTSTMSLVTAPSTAPTSNVRQIKYSPNGSHLFLNVTDVRNFYFYNRTGMAICANPAVLSGNTTAGNQALSWSQDGLKWACTGQGSPGFIVGTRSGDTFTNVTTTTTTPTQSCNALVFQRDTVKLHVSVAKATPFLFNYDVASTYTINTNLTQPAASPTCMDSTL